LGSHTPLFDSATRKLFGVGSFPADWFDGLGAAVTVAKADLARNGRISAEAVADLHLVSTYIALREPLFAQPTSPQIALEHREVIARAHEHCEDLFWDAPLPNYCELDGAERHVVDLAYSRESLSRDPGVARTWRTGLENAIHMLHEHHREHGDVSAHVCAALRASSFLRDLWLVYGEALLETRGIAPLRPADSQTALAAMQSQDHRLVVLAWRACVAMLRDGSGIPFLELPRETRLMNLSARTVCEMHLLRGALSG
jgi:hypothetical protein